LNASILCIRRREGARAEGLSCAGANWSRRENEPQTRASGTPKQSENSNRVHRDGLPELGCARKVPISLYFQAFSRWSVIAFNGFRVKMASGMFPRTEARPWWN
jgi:hypothetical protein